MSTDHQMASTPRSMLSSTKVSSMKLAQEQSPASTEVGSSTSPTVSEKSDIELGSDSSSSPRCEPILDAPGPLPQRENYSKREKSAFAALSSCKIPRSTTMTRLACELDGAFGMELRSTEDELQALAMDLGDLQL
eukprot:gnl/MRDRNA2_/MRDRNA2_110466_c0_seq1.p1 gnl/MRDRNA2_/MRDRNA2_110466_c0~~gnl/MRDRNA2_/MRDRNA2_110466_c0_seq1.p1  ORF type:complete len:135 (+),score=25.85 gnl/MRDRNA2_/MRDRNA2_110466_c0_seq1:157-561(+)